MLDMALGYLKLSDRAMSADTVKINPNDVRPLYG